MDNYDDIEEPGFFRKHRVAVSLAAVVALVIVGFGISQLFKKGQSTESKAPPVQMVRLAPPPPPPPKPTPPPPQPQQVKQEQPKMVEQTPINEPVDKPEDPKPDEPPASPLAVDAQGSGPGDAFGLVGRPGARGIGDGGNGNRIGGGGRGGKWGWYASQIQSQIEAALRGNEKTRNAAGLRIEVRLWPDRMGRVERVALANSTGDTALDAIIKNDVLSGLKLTEPPPEGMPLPIVLRVTARRPN